MNKFYKKISLLFLGGCVLSACKKESKEEAVVFPLTFHMEGQEITPGVRLFTKDGEINDPGKIANFVKYHYYFQIPPITSNTKFPFLSFSSKNQAEFLYDSSQPLLDVVKKNNRFLFTSTKEKIWGDQGATKGLFKHQHLRKIPNYELYYRKEMSVAYGDYKMLKFPHVRYFISRRIGNNIIEAHGNINNEINELFISTLRDNDTLAYTTYNTIGISVNNTSN
ncbi:hypothetical protein [Pedobacter gandavensis]|uniref:hypothetical protein n=1 Tax=Pedobacter gandavensis TaxID=2679963 RepID=UPI0029314864|nr:hypothetical protein [Pedobacter gandavensis]